MTHNQLLDIQSKINEELSANRFSMAFNSLYNMALAENAPWELRDKIDTLKESYKYMCQYALDGITDADREAVVEAIRGGIVSVTDSIIRLALCKDSPSLYFSTLRYENLQTGDTLSNLMSEYRKNMSKLGMTAFSGKNDILLPDGTSLRVLQEKLAVRIFNLVWVKYPLSTDDEHLIGNIFSDDSYPLYFKELILSAVMLGNFSYYDERRMILLANAYLAGVQHLEVKALCALLLSVWMARDVLSGKRFMQIMDTIKEQPQWKSDLKMIFLSLAHTRDTDRISKKLTEEVIPEMMKLRPDLYNKLNDITLSDDSDGADINPEWEEILEKSGIADRLRELNDLQADGGDVMMSTFSHMKTDSFFNDLANWFLPFYEENSNVTKSFGSPSSELLAIVSGNPLMCDSDKYSLAFSFNKVPDNHRRMLIEQFKSQGIDFSELQAAELNPEQTSRNNVASSYIRDLYRFFKLFRRKGEFRSPFSTPINLAAVKCLADGISDTDTLWVVAEFYFKRGYYNEATELYSLIMDKSGQDSQLLQKLGYCRQQQGLVREALELYLKSEFIRPGSMWTVRHIAQCHRIMGNYTEASDYYRRIVEHNPEDLSASLCLGHCLLELGNYEEAIKYYFKVEFLDEKSRRALRPIAWCSFLTKDFDRSITYYRKIIDDNPGHTDYLNLGHLKMAMNHFHEAVDCYTKSVQSDPAGIDGFIKSMNEDRHHLVSVGVEPFMIDLVSDSVISRQY